MSRLALIAVLAVAASACTIDVNVVLDLTERGAAAVRVDIEADDEFHRLYRLTGGEFEDLVARRGNEVGLAFQVTPGEPTRYSAQTNVLAANAVEELLEGLAPGIGDIEISATEAELTLDGALNPLTSLEDVAVYFEQTDPGQFADDVTVTINASIPGDVVTSTGTAAGANRLFWNIPFSDSDSRVLARTALVDDGGSIPWAWIIIGATVALAFGFLVAIRSRYITQEGAATTPRPIPNVKNTAPEDQPVGVDETPPEDQSVEPESPVSD